MSAKQQVVYNDRCTVLFRPQLDGGGSTFGQDVVRFVANRIGPVEHAMEWCSGPGFIGFSLLAAGLARRLTLVDVNPEAVAVVRETIAFNDLADRVEVFQSDCLAGVPPRTVDLVVANPPHVAADRVIPQFGPELLYRDPGWAAHREFYGAVAGYVRPGGSVLLQENSLFSAADDFRPMIEAAGLDLAEVSPSVAQYYFVWSRTAGSASGEPAC